MARAWTYLAPTARRHSPALLSVATKRSLQRSWQPAADVNTVRRTGKQTLLHDVAVYNHHAVVKLLLARGAITDAVDSDGMIPLLVAAKNDRPSIMAELLLQDVHMHPPGTTSTRC